MTADTSTGEAVTGRWIDEIEARSNLTRSQFLIWMGQQVEPSSPLYNMVFAFRLRGPLDGARFARAFAALVEESDALRTVLREVDGVPRQEVLTASDVPALQPVDFGALEDAEQACERWVHERSRVPLAMARSLYESALLRVSDTHHVWYLKLHHLVSDAWATSLLCERLARHYEGDGTMADAFPPFADYVAREREGRERKAYANALRFWDRQLARPAERQAFYGSTGALGRTSRTRRLRRPLGAERSAALRALAARPGQQLLNEELSLFRLTATAVLALMQRISGAERLCLGVPMHNRLTARDKGTPGLYMEVFPLFVDLAADESFASLGAKVGRAVVDTLSRGLPGSSTPAGNRAYDVLLNFVTARMRAPGDLQMQTDWVHAGAGDAAHKLRIQVHDFDASGALCVDFDANEGVFSPAAQELLARHFLAIVDGLLDQLEQPVRRLALASPEDQQAQLVNFNATARHLADEGDVDEAFRAQVARTPQATALRSAELAWSYAELDQCVNDLASYLRQAGHGPGAVVALLQPRSAEAVVAMLASLRAGGAYLPLDPRHPPARLSAILDDLADSSMRLTGVLTSRALTARVPANHRTLDLDAAPKGAPAPAPAGTATDLAYLIYTSGSTGTPKGVQISRGALSNYLFWARQQYCADGAKDFALHTSLAVDLTVTSIYTPLLCGGSVVVYPDQGENDLPVLRVFEEDAVDVVKLTPAHLELIREFGSRAERISTLILGGEDLKVDLARAVADQFPPSLVLYNEYGPTEATVGCMIHRFDAAADTAASVPIGHPIANATIYLLDDHLTPVATGLLGEICIGGAAVADGYVNRPALTAERFVDVEALGGARVYRTGDLGRWTVDGRLEYLGRGDAQVKVRGARIELAEVEATATAHAQVGQGVAVVVDRATQDPVRFCTRCGMPSNYPGIVFNDDDVCSMCVTFERHATEAQAYFQPRQALEDIASTMRERRTGDYDCIVLLSGGKDSTYMIYQVAAMGLKILALTLDNGFISEGALENTRLVAKALGVDQVMARTPHMNAIFADSLRRHSNVCHGCFKTIYTLAINEARQRKIPYIVTGLSRGQIFETRLDEMFRHRQFDVAQVERAIIDARKVYHRIDDAVARHLDVSAFDDDKVFEEIEFVDFYRYWDVPLDEVYAYLEANTPWRRPVDTGRSTNCLINEAGIYVHRKERGFHNYALPYSWDVRLGHKTREAALHELDDEIDTRRVREILAEVGYREPPARDEARLALYYTPAATDLTPDALREHLAQHLPDEMMPAYLVPMQSLPLAPTGKVDRKALPTPWELQGAGQGGAPYVAPTTEVEQQLAALWCELLGVDQVGVHDDFFDLGGASLTAIQALGRVRDAFAVELPLQSFFAAPTLGAVAQAVETAMIEQIESLSDDEVARLLGES